MGGNLVAELVGNPRRDGNFLFRHLMTNAVSVSGRRGHAIAGIYEQSYLSQANESLVYEKILTDIIERGQLEKIDEITTDFFLSARVFWRRILCGA